MLLYANLMQFTCIVKKASCLCAVPISVILLHVCLMRYLYIPTSGVTLLVLSRNGGNNIIFCKLHKITWFHLQFEVLMNPSRFELQVYVVCICTGFLLLIKWKSNSISMKCLKYQQNISTQWHLTNLKRDKVSL